LQAASLFLAAAQTWSLHANEIISLFHDRFLVCMRHFSYYHCLHVLHNTAGDDHVSFTPMDVSYSPNGKYFLVSTDRGLVVCCAVFLSVIA
jgi:hypothetical protein